MQGSLLPITLLAGLILLILSGVVLTVFYLIERSESKVMRQQDSFYRILHEYDISVDMYKSGIYTGTEKEFEKLNSELDRLEKRVIGVESWLSLLKRRRNLAKLYPPSTKAYHNAVVRALEAYPQSQPVAALAAAAFVKDAGLNRETQQKLRELIPLLTDFAFGELRLSLHVILGDFKNPQAAAQIETDFLNSSNEDTTVDLAILKILRADFQGAAAQVQDLYNRFPTTGTLRFLAEYLYDFGDLRRSAQFFSYIPEDDNALLRQADALFLAGLTPNARSIWSILANSNNENAIYNLAVTAEKSDEAEALFEKLVNIDSSSITESRQAGLIHYSRLLDYPQAIKLLEKTDGIKPSDFPYIDLELCRRHSVLQERGRQLAEAWMLLDRHPENEELYRWAAWLMFFQRYFDEADILLRRAENLNFEGNWDDIYRAIYLMTEGNLDKAESILRPIASDDGKWYVYANLARIFEEQRSPSRALDQYEKAIALLDNPKKEARIKFREAKCYNALARPSEAMQALRQAVDLDPDNHSARLELDRTTRP